MTICQKLFQKLAHFTAISKGAVSGLTINFPISKEVFPENQCSQNIFIAAAASSHMKMVQSPASVTFTHCSFPSLYAHQRLNIIIHGHIILVKNGATLIIASIIDSFSSLVPAASQSTAISGSHLHIDLRRSGASRDSLFNASSFVITHFAVFASRRTLSAFFPILRA